MMKYGVILPGGTATEQLEQAELADQAGWDGVFVWEAAYGVDAWSPDQMRQVRDWLTDPGAHRGRPAARSQLGCRRAASERDRPCAS